MESDEINDENRKVLVNEILNKIPDYMQKIKCDTTQWQVLEISFSHIIQELCYRTPPFKCAVLSCHNIFFKSDDHNKAAYKFHNFPSSNELCKIWLEKCRVAQDFNIWSAKVCSEHFSLDDYERNYKEEMQNPEFKRQLKSTAIPSVNLEGPEAVVHLPENPHRIDINDIKAAVDENDALTETLNSAEAKQKELHSNVKYYEKRLEQKQKEYLRIKIQYDKLKQRASNVRNHKNMLSKVFSESQINVLLGKRKVIWSDDDLAMAFTLRQMSSAQCYLYLKKTLNMPLPALSCVQKWAASASLSNHNSSN